LDTHAPRKSAYAKMMDYLSRRELSEFELRAKLLKLYAEDDVDDALKQAKQSNWLPAPEEMSERVAATLARKNKGHHFINAYLEQKGLPPVMENLENEVVRARDLIASKFKHDFETNGALPGDLTAQAQRLLFNRGFSSETIRRALAR
jgi:SOS response regulatory protein OraA/RecX